MLATCLKEVVRAGDDVVINALLLAFLVNRHVAEYSQTKLCDFTVRLLERIFCVGVVKQFRELLNRIFSEQRLDAHIAKSQVDESFKKID